MIRQGLAIVALALAFAWIPSARADSGLTTVAGPSGGQIVYGIVQGQSTPAGAMAAVLRSVHAQCGDRPQVGRPFQVRGTGSVAVFFTATKHSDNDTPIAGMVLVATPAADGTEAALLTDRASRFGSSVNPMLKALFEIWPPGGGGSSATVVAGSGAAALHQATLPDNSASVGLPDGWRISQESGGGTIIAEGPNGEKAALGFPLLAMNSADPRVQQTMRFAEGAGRNTSYARALYYPYGGDPARAYVELIQLFRQRHGAPPGNFQIASAQPMNTPGSRCTHLTGTLDLQDGAGPQALETIFCTGPLSPMGQYMNLIYSVSVPAARAAAEQATAQAILASFSLNQAVVSAEARTVAAPAIAAIHAIGARAAAQAQSAHAAEDAQAARVEQRWDSQDRANQGFSNYLLDQTVIADGEGNGHATVWNQTADALVESNPQRFQYVGTSNYWKGVDY